jgi:hypothetical protein
MYIYVEALCAQAAEHRRRVGSIPDPCSEGPVFISTLLIEAICGSLSKLLPV